jgi:hypothetical protein
MTETQHCCFFIMPFTPESFFIYQYLKEHIESNFKIKCERADQLGGCGVALDKIRKFIQKSDVIIADCSGGNSNVMFELGIAVNEGIDIIFINKDESKDIPFDIRHFDFINYEKNKPIEFLGMIDLAINQIFSERYEAFFKRALEIQKQFN